MVVFSEDDRQTVIELCGERSPEIIAQARYTASCLNRTYVSVMIKCQVTPRKFFDVVSPNYNFVSLGFKRINEELCVLVIHIITKAKEK